MVVDSDVERLMLMKQEAEILERQARRAGEVKVGAGVCRGVEQSRLHAPPHKVVCRVAV